MACHRNALGAPVGESPHKHWGSSFRGAAPKEIEGDKPAAPASTPEAERNKQRIESLRVTIRNVPADKMRDVIKVAVLPFAASGAQVETTLEIAAEAGDAGIPRETLDLTVLEGLRQLGLEVDLEIDDRHV